MQRFEKQRAARRGFTLLEVTMTAGFLVVSLLSVGLAVQTGLASTREQRERQLLKMHSQVYVDRVMALNFGQTGDPVPSAPQLDELFDDDADPGSVTLTSLARAPAADGCWKFTLRDFPLNGEWSVRVTPDLDADGQVAGSMETSGSFLRITVAFNDVPMLSTVRGKETQS